MHTKVERRKYRNIGDSMDIVNIETTATVQMNDGCTVTLTSPAHRKVPHDNSQRIEQIHAAQTRTIARLLDRLDDNLPGGAARTLTEAEKAAARDADGGDRADRGAVLEGTAPGTEDVFDLIDELRTAPIRWAADPARGIRGSLNSPPPELQRIDGRYALAWAWNPEALCPLAAAIATRTAGADEDGDPEHGADTAQNDPMGAARREYSRVNGLAETPGRFTMESAAWAMLVRASDNARIEEWIDDQDMEVTDDEIETLSRTLEAITTWLNQRLTLETPRRSIVEPSAPRSA